jgi:excisionase family DNA binding protein
MSEPEPFRNNRAAKRRPVLLSVSSGPKRLYTVQEAAAKLNLPSSWLYARTGKNEIPFRRFGKYIRFTDEDLEAMIVSGAHKSD